MNRRGSILIIPVVVGSVAGVGLVLATLFFYLFDELTLTLRIILGAVTVGGVILVVVGVVFAALILWEWRQQAIERTLQAQQETKLKRLQVDESQVRILATSRIIHTASAGDQVYLHDLLANLTTPLHLQPGPTNGQRIEPTELDIEHWRINQIAHGRRSIGSQAEPLQLDSGSEPLQPILPILVQAQRLIIAGGSDSGKTTLTKHLIAARSDHSRIVVIDPHSPSKILGFNVIGAGRDYGIIALALESLELLMNERYNDVARGMMGYFEHERVSIFIDEWTGIKRAIPKAGDILATLLTESRKVNMHLTILAHSTTVDALGLPDAQIRKSSTIVELVGGNGQPHRAFVLPNAKTAPDGSRARPVEFALPGPFDGYASPRAEVVLELPSPEIIKVQKMADEGLSKRAMIKELFPNVGNPGKAHYEQLEEILKRAEAARKARLG